MTTLDAHAEVMKLARLLGADPARFAYLERVDPAAVRALRDLATDVLHEDDRRLGRVALASRIPPAPLTAWIAQHLFGALLCARVAGLLEPRRAIDLARRMPPPYLADLAMQLDPRRVSAIIRGLPAGLIAQIAALLTARDEHVVMGRFVGHMTDEALLASFAVIDDASLLRIAYFVEQDDALDHVVGLLADERLRGVARAAGSEDLWPLVRSLLRRVCAPRARALVAVAGDLLPEHVRAAIVPADPR